MPRMSGSRLGATMRPARDLGPKRAAIDGWFWDSPYAVSMFHTHAHHYTNMTPACGPGWVLFQGYPAAEGDDLCEACMNAEWGTFDPFRGR